MMKFGDAGQGTDIFGIRGDGFPYYFHFGIITLESLIVVLLTCRHLPVALGNLFLELSLADCQFFEDAFNTVQPVVAIRHAFKLSNSSLSLAAAFIGNTPDGFFLLELTRPLHVYTAALCHSFYTRNT